MGLVVVEVDVVGGDTELQAELNVALVVPAFAD